MTSFVWICDEYNANHHDRHWQEASISSCARGRHRKRIATLVRDAWEQSKRTWACSLAGCHILPILRKTDAAPFDGMSDKRRGSISWIEAHRCSCTEVHLMIQTSLKKIWLSQIFFILLAYTAWEYNNRILVSHLFFFSLSLFPLILHILYLSLSPFLVFTSLASCILSLFPFSSEKN